MPAADSEKSPDGPATSNIPPEIEETYARLEAKFLQNLPEGDAGPLCEAFLFAAQVHAGQVRRSKLPFISHPLEVAHILADRQMDSVCLQTALLHDTLEESPITVEDIRRKFGDEVARCVDGVTKLSKLHFYSREERQAESVRKMLLAMVSDIRVILVKLADRLHNMRTLEFLDEEQKQRISQETLEIYAPIANRLGMGRIRAELEDLAFSYQDPEAFSEMTAMIESTQEGHEDFLGQVSQSIKTRLGRENISARVEVRMKRAYSVHQKIRRQKIGFDQVYDLLGMRIVTDSVRNCYAALGMIHDEWPPIPGRIKDFIALPRPNLYQSLHTSVIGPGGVAFEVQIRTEEMHRIAEEGIAAHWKYKEGRRGANSDEQQIAWLRQLVEWQREMRDSGDFMSTLKVDLYPEEVYTFTPRGKVIALPRDATPLDFAYAIHSDVGHSCVGAKVNGRIVPLRYALKNGDVVEILTQAGHQPSRDWLALVKTSRARNKIRQVIKATERVKAIDLGQKMLEREARRLGIQIGRIPREQMERAAADYGCSKMEDLYAALGYGKYSPRQVLHKAAPDSVPAEVPETKTAAALPAKEKEGDQDLVLTVRDLDDALVYRSKCCNPIRGEAIVGYITRGKGVAVHSRRCPNVQNLMYEPERRIEVGWTRSGSHPFAVKMIVHMDDNPGMLHKLTNALYQENSNIRNLEARSESKAGWNGAVVEMTVEVKDAKQLDRVVAMLRRISGVRDIERVQ